MLTYGRPIQGVNALPVSWVSAQSRTEKGRSGCSKGWDSLINCKFGIHINSANGLKVKKMSASENKELIRNMFVELSKGNAEAFLGSLADNVRFTVIGTTKYSGTFNGKQEFISKALEPLSAQLDGGISLTVDNFIADGNYVAMQARGKSNTKGGGTYNNTYCTSSASLTGKSRKLSNTSIPNS
jgi:uncharacterized protein